MPKSTLNVDRKTASKMLRVSVRTIDRHIKTGKLAAYRKDGRIWLNKNAIAGFRAGALTAGRQPIDKSYLVRPVSAQSRHANTDFYKDLYEETKRALGEYRQKLDQSNYRTGQLESQLLHSSFGQKTHDRNDNLENELLRKDIIGREKEFSALKELAQRERTSRIIFSVLTYLLLLMLPALWYLLR